MILPIAIHKDKNSAYGVTIPDVSGCYSWGDTIEEAISNAKEAIYSHFEIMIESGEEISLASSDIEALKHNSDYSEAFWAIVDIDPMAIDTTPERVNISIPKFVLRRIDQHTKKSHETRSGFLARAAMNELSLIQHHTNNPEHQD
jgi:predicted RNase H-like HicB family nuclease